MDLYDDIIPSDELKTDKDSNHKNWSNSTSLNLLKNHLKNKRQQSKPPNQFKPRQTVFSKPKQTNLINTQPVINQQIKYTNSLLGGEWNASLEYDPFWPNDYEKIKKEKNLTNNQTTTTTVKTKLTAPVIKSLNSRPLVDAYSDDDEEETDKKSFGAAIAPPPSLIESSATNNNSYNNVPPINLPTTTSETSSINNMNVSDVAAKLMAKMGYKEGKGLGKNMQGISTALQVEKTSKNSGIIISNNANIVTTQLEEDFTASLPSNQLITSNTDDKTEEQEESITEIMKNPTKVIMLRNMVGQGEVDADLEPEVKEECSKFGEVSNCLIYEVNEGIINGKRMANCKTMNVPDDQSVRIFVEFARVESAIKALIDLNGRYFGGRVVKGTFYDLEQFKKMELSN